MTFDPWTGLVLSHTNRLRVTFTPFAENGVMSELMLLIMLFIVIYFYGECCYNKNEWPDVDFPCSNKRTNNKLVLLFPKSHQFIAASTDDYDMDDSTFNVAGNCVTDSGIEKKVRFLYCNVGENSCYCDS